jgi:hypothetical protein
MNVCAQASHMNDLAGRKRSLTPDFSPVIAGSGKEKPFKPLPASACAGTRLKPSVNEK